MFAKAFWLVIAMNSKLNVLFLLIFLRYIPCLGSILTSHSESGVETVLLLKKTGN
jgi:hypothetical protein